MSIHRLLTEYLARHTNSLADRIVLLKPGPGATIGASFTVDLTRPRNKTALNSDPYYKKLRNEIIEYLIDVGSQRDHKGEAEQFVLPDLEPVAL